MEVIGVGVDISAGKGITKGHTQEGIWKVSTKPDAIS